MRSNTGVIGAQRLNTTSSASGLHGLADLYGNVKGATWPAGTASASVVPSASSVNEGGTVAFVITAYAPGGQTTLYWSMRATTGTATSADFGDSSISGSVVMTAGYAGILTGTVSRTWASDLFTEGTEAFVMDIALTNGGAVIGTGPAVTVADTSVSPVATVTGIPSSINEGSSVTYTITIVSGVTAGTTVYWVMRATTGTATASDFNDSTLSGSYVVSSGLVDTVTRTWANDVATEGTETFVMDVRIGSITGTVIGTSSPATTVADTSVASAHALGAFTDTLSSDPGDGAFTVLYSGGALDEGSVQVDTGITFLVQGASMTRIGINTNSYVVFGTSASTFSYPNYVWNDTQPAFPGVGCCAGNDSSNDGNYQFVGYRSVAGGFQIRFKGAVPYSQATVNRIWDLTVYSGSNQIKVEYRALSTTAGTTYGNLIAFKSATAVTYQSTAISAGQAWSFWT